MTVPGALAAAGGGSLLTPSRCASEAVPGRGRGAAAVRVRQAAGNDRPALERMLDRCTGQTRYRRFHGHVTAFPERYLAEALSGSPVHFALVAAAVPTADVVALASCRLTGEGVAELGILVEDGWQRRGIGGRLLCEVAGHAGRAGLRALTAQVLAEQAWIIPVLRGYGTCLAVPAGEALEVTVRLAVSRPGITPPEW